TVIDNTTGQPWTNTELGGLVAAHDTATIGGQGATHASGSVTYTRFTNGTCSGTPTTTQTVTVNADGTVPSSSNTAALATGNYSYQASYTGDSNYAASTGTCEPFGSGLVACTVTTTVFDIATSLAWTNTEQTGATAHD